MGDKEKDSSPAEQQLKHIPRRSSEHEDMPTVLWSKKKDTETILEFPLGLRDVVYDHSRPDKDCKTTVWDVYKTLKDGKLAILWNIQERKKRKLRIMITEEAFELARSRFSITEPQVMRKIVENWTELAGDTTNTSQTSEEEEESNLVSPNQEPVLGASKLPEQKSLAVELAEAQRDEQSSSDGSEEGQARELEEDLDRINHLESEKLTIRKTIQTRLMAKRGVSASDPEILELKKKEAKMESETKLWKAKAEVTKNQKLLRAEQKKSSKLNKELEEVLLKNEDLQKQREKEIKEEKSRIGKLEGEYKSVVAEYGDIVIELQRKEDQLRAEQERSRLQKATVDTNNAQILELEEALLRTEGILEEVRGEVVETRRKADKAIKEKDEQLQANNLHALAEEGRYEEAAERNNTTQDLKMKLQEAYQNVENLEETLNKNLREMEILREVEVVLTTQKEDLITKNNQLMEEQRILKQEAEKINDNLARQKSITALQKDINLVTQNELQEEKENIEGYVNKIAEWKEKYLRLNEKYISMKFRALDLAERRNELQDEIRCIREEQREDREMIRGRRGRTMEDFLNGEGYEQEEEYVEEFYEDDVFTGREIWNREWSGPSREQEDGQRYYEGDGEDEEDYNDNQVEERQTREENRSVPEGNRIPVIIGQTRQPEGNNQGAYRRMDGQRNPPGNPKRKRESVTSDQDEGEVQDQAPEPQRRSSLQVDDRVASNSRPSTPPEGINIIVQPGVPGAANQIIQVIPQATNQAQENSLGFQHAIGAITTGLDKVTSAMATKMEKNTRIPSLIFYGTENTISFADWQVKMEREHEDDWDDKKKLDFAIKHLSPSNEKLKTFINREFASYKNLMEQLRLSFGSISKPFNLSKWQMARRFRGVTFKDWLCSPLAVELLDKTSTPWNEGQLSENEMAVIMENIQNMIPKKVLSGFQDGTGAWDYQKLKNVTFTDLVTQITQDEKDWENIWKDFNNSGSLPEVRDNTRNQYRVNIVGQAQAKTQERTYNQRRRWEVTRPRGTYRNVMNRIQQNQGRFVSFTPDNRRENRNQTFNRGNGSREGGFRYQNQRQTQNNYRYNQGRENQNKGNSSETRRSRGNYTREGSNFNRGYNTDRRNFYWGYQNNHDQRNQQNDRQQNRGGSNRFRGYQNRGGQDQNRTSRRINTMGMQGEYHQNNQNYTNHQTGISQELYPKNWKSPASGASHMGVGAARDSSGYRNH